MRLDQFLVKHKEVDSRTKAQDLIEKGHVYLSDPASGSKQTLRKSSFDVTDEIQLYIHIDANELSKYVSRAGLKLEGALKHTGLDVMFKYILDLGQSTGGFTDCLLQNGARKVIGVDVGSGQLHDKLLGHPQVISIENLNIKEIANNEQFQKTTQVNLFDIIVGDVSFISLTKFIQFAEPFLKPSGFYLLLVKPQFECGPEYLDKNGVVQDSAIYEKVENDIINHCQRVFGGHLDYFESSIKGKDGNREFFIYGQKTK